MIPPGRGAAPVVLALVVGVTGCGGPSQGGDDARSYPDLAAVLTDAQAHGAGPEQLDVLDKAVRQGEMTYDDLDSLVGPLSTCLEDAGFQVHPGTPYEDYPGFLTPSYAFTEPPGMAYDEWNAVESACENTYWNYAELYYVSQPRAIDAFYDDFERQRPEILSCLGSHGVAVVSDPTVAELVTAVMSDPRGHADGSWCYRGSIPNVPGT